MVEFTLKINPVTLDLVLGEEGDFVIVEGDECTAQNITNTLRALKGEFLFDETHGTDYDRILGEGTTDVPGGEVELILQEAIFQEPDVSVITEMNISTSNRNVTGDFKAELGSGAIITQEVPEYDQ